MGTDLEVLEQRKDARIDVQRVQPEREDPRFPLTLRIKVLHMLADDRGFLQRLQARMRIEQICDKRKVEARVSGDERRRRKVLSAPDAFSVIEDLFSSTSEVRSLEGRSGALVRLELIEEDGVVFAILDILTEVCHSMENSRSVGFPTNFAMRLLTFDANPRF